MHLSDEWGLARPIINTPHAHEYQTFTFTWLSTPCIQNTATPAATFARIVQLRHFRAADEGGKTYFYRCPFLFSHHHHPTVSFFVSTSNELQHTLPSTP